jgi:hypothetical protein
VKVVVEILDLLEIAKAAYIETCGVAVASGS